jgi:CBS-domain-containing membrane protein
MTGKGDGDATLKLKDVKVIEFIRPASTAKKDDTVSDALSLLKTGPGIVSIVDEKGRLMGAVNERCLIRLAKHEAHFSFSSSDNVWYDSLEKDSVKMPISRIMTTKVTSIRPGDSVLTALKLMHTLRSRFLHVVDADGKLVGLVRVRDIMERLLK